MVEITHYEIANKNKTIGYVDIRVPIIQPAILIFKKIAHVQNGDRRWFNFPSFQREDNNGNKYYHKFCQFEKEMHNNDLLECVAQKVRDYCEKHGISHGEKMDFDTFPDDNSSTIPF